MGWRMALKVAASQGSVHSRMQSPVVGQRGEGRKTNKGGLCAQRGSGCLVLDHSIHLHGPRVRGAPHLGEEEKERGVWQR